jgi:hypothetical protein
MVKKHSKKTKNDKLNDKLNDVYHKKKIPKKVKEEVWYINFGKIYETKCYISWCSNKINVFNFHVGHDIPESKGGTDEINNLKPICDRCNLSMGHNYTIKEWNIKFNKTSYKIGNQQYINEIIKYYNFYKYISIVVLIYLCFNNFEYSDSNINNNIDNNIDIDENVKVDEKNSLNHLNYLVNGFIKNISNYFYN